MSLRRIGFAFLSVLPLCGWSQAPGIDFLHADILIAPNPVTEEIEGEVRYEFSSTGTPDSIYLDAHNMEFKSLRLNGQAASYSHKDGKLRIEATGEAGRHELQISYRAFPRQAVYFIGWRDSLQGNEQVWTQGQGKDSSHWVPVADLMTEKVEFDVSILFETGYQVVSNGRLVETKPEGPRTRWVFDMEKPMSSYLLAFAIGRFDTLAWVSASGIGLQGFYPVGAPEKAHWTYRDTPELFSYLEKEIGIPYPWGDYKQVPVRDFLYAGMENTGATFFSDRYLVDSIGYNDTRYLNVNAHELAHQWFGNLVTETSASEHWLHEGFATFYAYEAESHFLGTDAVLWKLYDTARALEAMDASGRGESLLDGSAGSLTFYEKGGWAVYLLREQIGIPAFRKAVRSFLQEFAYANARVDDFLKAAEGHSGASLEGFRKTWLEAPAFPVDTALAYLKRKSKTISQYLELLEGQEAGASPRESAIGAVWDRYDSPPLRAHLLRAFRDSLTPAFLEARCREGSLPVQKAFMETTKTFQEWMIPMVEAWLDAPSYELREASLFRLWVEVPHKRKQYLDRVSRNGSLSQLRMQQFWWLLALITEGYGGQEAKQEYLERLRATTAPSFPWETREQAFSMLYEVGGLSRENLLDLMQATEHHSWQFKKFARRLLDELIREQPEPAFWKGLAETFPRERFGYLYQKIDSL